MIQADSMTARQKTLALLALVVALVLEIVDGQAHFYENRLGVLTNSPGFEWQMTNLCNYVNLHGGSAPGQSLDSVALAPFGAGSGMLGLPGDVTPPSRFVRMMSMASNGSICEALIALPPLGRVARTHRAGLRQSCECPRVARAACLE